MNKVEKIEDGECVAEIQGYNWKKHLDNIFFSYLFLTGGISGILVPLSIQLNPFIFWIWIALFFVIIYFIHSTHGILRIYYSRNGLSFGHSSHEKISRIEFKIESNAILINRKKYRVLSNFQFQSNEILEFLENKQNKEWSKEFKDFKKWTWEIHRTISGEILKRVDSLLKDVIAGKYNKTKKEYTEINFYQFEEKVYMEVLEKFSDLIHSYQNDENFKSDLNLLEKQLREEIYEVLDAVILETIHNLKSDFDASI